MEVYDKQAAEFLERSYQTPEIINQRLRTLEALALVNGESVLDAGCGTGLLLELEAKAVGEKGRADGIDYSDDMLAHARTRCAGLEQASLHQGSVETLPFADASYDALSCTQTLLYVDDLDAAIAGYYRVLRPRGRLAIIETDWSGVVVHSHDQVLTRRIFDAWDGSVANPNLPRRLRPLLASHGFASIRVAPIPILNVGGRENTFSGCMLANFAKTARKQGAIDESESRAWLDGIALLAERGEYFFCVNRFLITAVK